MVAAASDELRTGFSGRVVDPAGVALIEPVLPGLVLGPLDGARLALGFTAAAAGAVPPDGLTALALAAAAEGGGDGGDGGGDGEGSDGGDGGVVQTLPERLLVPVVRQGEAVFLDWLVVEDGRLTLDEATGRVVLSGSLATEAVVGVVVRLGGGAFDEQGARRMVATFLGYEAGELPALVPFLVEYRLQ